MADDRPTTFASLGVPTKLVEVLAASGIDAPFPIQAATLPDSLAGRDVLGRGRTGSGKTLAFALPIVARLAASAAGNERRSGRPRALILAPTRELVAQINETLMPLTKPLGLRTVTVFGGVSAGPQVAAFRKGVDVVIACPGRLEDHLGQGNLSLDAVEITVLDEADHMADLGFLPGVKRIMDRTPKHGQRMLFSATLDGGIDVLVKRYLHDPVTHSVDSETSPVAAMEHHVFHVASGDRLPVLVDLASAPGRTMIFTRTKHRAKQLTKQLISSGVPAVEMHGNLAQNTRTRNLAAFSDGRATALVATDIAARGIHVDDVTLVIHADPPVEHKAYLHRSGRTARAGNDGTVVTLATEEQRSDVRQLARKAGINPTVSQVRLGDPLLTTLAPGERTVLTAAEIATALPGAPQQQRPAGGGGNHRPRKPSNGAARGGRGSGGGRNSTRSSSTRRAR
ncbi:MAG: DEAD/DEAH box helicase [Acidimicrobiales bacterium]